MHWASFYTNVALHAQGVKRVVVVTSYLGLGSTWASCKLNKSFEFGETLALVYLEASGAAYKRQLPIVASHIDRKV